MNPWDRIIPSSADSLGPQTAESLKTVEDSARELFFVIANGIDSLNQLMADYGDDLESESGTNITRLLTGLGAVTLRLRLIEDDAVQRRAKLQKRRTLL